MGDAALARLDGAEHAGRVGVWWGTRVAGWRGLGIAGVRLLGLSRVPGAALAPLLGALRRACPGATLIGWTPGIDWAAAQGLAGGTLDGVVPSLPWWNWRDEWLWRELEHAAPGRAADRLSGGARRPAACRRLPDAGLRERMLRRALGVAASLAPGLLLPMGFEFGLTGTEALGPADPAALRCVRAARSDRRGHAREYRDARGGTAAHRHRRAPALRPRRAGAGRAAGRCRRSAAARARRAAAGQCRFAAPQPRACVAGSGGGWRVVRRLRPAIAAGRRRRSRRWPSWCWHRARPGSTPLPPPRNPPASWHSSTARGAEAAAAAPRIAIESVTPRVEGGAFAAKRVARRGGGGGGRRDRRRPRRARRGPALARAGDERRGARRAMRPLGNDRWRARFPLRGSGGYEFTVEAWRDAFGTFPRRTRQEDTPPACRPRSN